jgi:alkanesulfonate monooxygenase SsuD/methylene tetrahydromethanopterin reductase-like flavin-dependent oxidoreductase (luciferase family)
MASKIGRERKNHGDIFRRHVCRHVWIHDLLLDPVQHFLVDETYQGKFDASHRGGSMVAQLDPVIFISAMASVTKSVSFAITGSLSYIPVGTPVRVCTLC